MHWNIATEENKSIKPFSSSLIESVRDEAQSRMQTIEETIFQLLKQRKSDESEMIIC